MGFLGSIFGGGSSVQNPSNVAQANQNFNDVQAGIGQSQSFLNALQGLNGIQNQGNVFNQLQNVANGQGPNPAQAMLNNTTGQNVAQQAALMGSQRGVSSNPGLLARQAAQQGSQIQQQAAGQGAALQAQQSLGALGQLGGLASQQVQQQQNALGQYNAATQGARGQTLNSIGGQNTNATTTSNNAGQNILGGVAGALGSVVGLAEGGQVPNSHVGRHLLGLAEGGMALDLSEGSSEPVPGKAKVKGDSYKNDTIPAMLSPGETVVPRSKAKDPKKAAAFAAAVAMKNRRKK